MWLDLNQGVWFKLSLKNMIKHFSSKTYNKKKFFTSMCQKIVSKKMPMMRCSIFLFSVRSDIYILCLCLFFSSLNVKLLSFHTHMPTTLNWKTERFLSVSLWKYFNRQENELSKVIKIVLIEKESPIKIMAGSRRSIQKLLDRHKLQIARELDPSQSAILTQLTKKGVIISEEERQILVWFIR